MKTYIKSPWWRRVVRLLRLRRYDLPVTDRQELIPGFDQKALETARVMFIGCGGLGGEVLVGLVRQGLCYGALMDHDVIEPTNLNRQFFFPRDIFRNKAQRLAMNVLPHATKDCVLEAYDLRFQDALALGIKLNPTVVYCGVDNNETRLDVCRYFRSVGVPVVYSAIDLIAEHCYVFIQEPEGPCFGCAFPQYLKPGRTPCRAGASIDCLKVAAGLAIFAINSVLMPGRKRNWNYRNVHLAGFVPGSELLIERRTDCPLCHE